MKYFSEGHSTKSDEVEVFERSLGYEMLVKSSLFNPPPPQSSGQKNLSFCNYQINQTEL